MQRLKQGFMLLLALSVTFPYPIDREIQAAYGEPSSVPVVEQDVLPSELQTPERHINVSIVPAPLTAKILAEKYAGYQITLTNSGSSSVTLISAYVENGFSGEQAYQATKKKLVGRTSLLGISGFVTTAIRRKRRNNRGRDEASHFSNTISLVPLESGESVTTKTLVSLGQTPRVRVTYRDHQTGQIYGAED